MRVVPATLAALGLSVFGSVAHAAPPADPPEIAADVAPRAAFDTLKTAWEKALQDYYDGFKVPLRSQEDVDKAQARYPTPEKWAPRFQAIADKAPKDPAAADCIAWIVEKATKTDVQEPAIARLSADDCFPSPAVGAAGVALCYSYAENAEKFLRRVIDEHPLHDVQGLGRYGLGKMLMRRIEFAAWLREGDGSTRERYEKNYGKAFTRNLVAADAEALTREAEGLFDEVVKNYGDVKLPISSMGKEKLGKTLRELAGNDLFEIRSLAIGKVAPEIVGKDADGKEMKLSGFRGKVVVLDFWSFG